MTRIRHHLTAPDLAPLAHAAGGPHRTLAGVTRLPGGSKKGAYRLTYDDGSTAIAYVWSPDEDYWDHTEVPDHRRPFSPANGLGLFTAAHDRLAAAGVRTPRLLLADAAGRFVGPLRLLDGDFPAPGQMRAIAESNLLRVLEILGT
ncbi:hypothetical protein [Streptomyces sp. NBC_01235]|uniref:hypothetical protein n=1 Tax=Streptomyces sp. NBC_01235 TaxID=2903788 RepID=UPI002E118D7B|nr:hypothetical protein OG289_32645 [Streptomyces sp. NBC_01235]